MKESKSSMFPFKRPGTRATLCSWLAPLLAALLPLGGMAHAAPSQTIDLTSIHFVSSTTGWGLTDTMVVRSTNAGAIWNKVTPPGLSIKAYLRQGAYFLNANDAWVANSASITKPGIFRTTNGGRTWQQTIPPAPALSGGPVVISQIDFINSQQGWALESLGGGAGSFYFALLHTADGGAHWSFIAQGPGNPPTPGAYPRNVQGINFDSATSGWTTVVIFAGPQLSGAYHSTDGGRTWLEVTLPLTGAFSMGFLNVQPPVFFDTTHGALVVGTDKAVGIYVTTDGGTTWTPTAPLIGSVPLASPQPISAELVDPAHGWVIVGTHFYFTPDLGLHWSLVRQNLGFGTIGILDYLNAQVGWALGGNRSTAGVSQTALRHTTNGGHNWTILHPVLA
jgi:photosystem II stability/assembly factor-like uncharacterized protein